MALCSIYKLRQTKLSQFEYFSLVLKEQEETKNKYYAPLWILIFCILGFSKCNTYIIAKKYVELFLLQNFLPEKRIRRLALSVLR